MSEEKRKSMRDQIPPEALEHMKAARDEMRKSMETILPPGFLEHRRAARRVLGLVAQRPRKRNRQQRHGRQAKQGRHPAIGADHELGQRRKHELPERAAGIDEARREGPLVGRQALRHGTQQDREAARARAGGNQDRPRRATAFFSAVCCRTPGTCGHRPSRAPRRA